MAAGDIGTDETIGSTQSNAVGYKLRDERSAAQQPSFLAWVWVCIGAHRDMVPAVETSQKKSELVENREMGEAAVAARCFESSMVALLSGVRFDELRLAQSDVFTPCRELYYPLYPLYPISNIEVVERVHTHIHRLIGGAERPRVGFDSANFFLLFFNVNFRSIGQTLALHLLYYIYKSVK